MAITAVNYRPHRISPAYNPIVYSFTSDQTFQIDFSYVIDINIVFNNGDTDVVRIKQSQNPAGNCIVDIASIVQPYIALTLYSAETGWTTTFRDSSEIVAFVHLLVGEEYKVGNSLQIYDGITNATTGAPAYYIGSEEDNTIPLKVIPSALPYYTHLSNMQSTTDYVFWSDYFMDGNGKFLKRDDNSIDVTLNDRHTLTFLNWWENETVSYKKVVYYVTVTFYTAAGSIISSVQYNNTQSVGGGPQTTNTYLTVTDDQKYSILTFKCGPKDFNITNPSIAYYTVIAYYKPSWTIGNPTPTGAIASETVRFNIDENCGSALYPRIRFSWLNDLGGRDYWNFTMFYEKTTNSTAENYSQTNLNWSDTLPLAISGNTTSNWLRGGNKTFNKNVTTEFTAQTDWLTQDEVDLLSGIAESSSVWAYIGTDDIPKTVDIMDTTYTYKNIKQTKLVQVTMKCRLTKIQIKQNL